MTIPTTPTTVSRFRLDPEHGGLRLVVFLTFIAGWLFGFVISGVLIPNEGVNILAVLVGFGSAYVISALVERLLKHRWHSGRAIEIDALGVKLFTHANLEREIMSEDPANALLWRFPVTRRTRVPKGHWMIACALEYERAYICAYTFVSPDQLERDGLAERFKVLVSTKQKRGAAPVERDDLRLAGEQRRLREAENFRWYEGGELTAPEFARYLAQLETQFPEWFTNKPELLA